jgi:three-Cys-motif partner protein
MGKAAFKWKIGGSLPKLESHSDAKLRLLRVYLDHYFDTVIVPRMDELSITFVDGFSGGGKYTRDGEERFGSPFVLLEAVKAAAERHNASRPKPIVIKAKFYFSDAAADAVHHLEAMLTDAGYSEEIKDGRINLQVGRFEALWQTIVEDIQVRHRAGRSIFVLDQKGWNAVQFQTIRSIMETLPRSEVLLTFAVDWLTSYLNEEGTFAKAMAKIGIEGQRLRAYVDAKGKDGYQFVIPRLLLADIKSQTGAPYFTPFFLRSERAQRDLWIVHLSKLVTARNVMVKSHWQVGNSSLHKGQAGLDMLGFVPHWEDGHAFDFAFDDVATSAMSVALVNEMPYRVEQLEKRGIPTVQQLFEALANDTAASREQIERAIALLHSENQIDLLSKTGRVKRRSSMPQMDDGIQISRSTLLPGIRW